MARKGEHGVNEKSFPPEWQWGPTADGGRKAKVQLGTGRFRLST